jgi:tetratricopeptide (TPR) repeat protein
MRRPNRRQGWPDRLAHTLVLVLAMFSVLLHVGLMWTLEADLGPSSVPPWSWLEEKKQGGDLKCQTMLRSIGTLHNIESTIATFREHNNSTCTASDLGDALYSTQNYAGAIKAYEYALQRTVGPENPYGLYERLFDTYARLNLTESMEAYARRAFLDSRRSDLMLRLANWYEALGDLDTAAHHYASVCQASRTEEHYEVIEEIDRRLLWPGEFPQAYLAELEAFEAILGDPEVSDDTKAQVHWEMIGRSRPILGCGEELFRREGAFRDDAAPLDQQQPAEFYYATPSILPHPERPHSDHLILVRLLNYRIDHEGRYYRDYLPHGDTSGVLRSSSVLYNGRDDATGQQLHIDDASYERTAYRYMGTEDPRLFRMASGETRIFWTSWEYAKHLGEGSRIVSGSLDPASGVVRVDHLFVSPLDRFLEKNWVAFQVPGDAAALRMVYEWHPLRIGAVKNDSSVSHLQLDREVPTPPSFRHIRGSSNGVFHQGQLWFLVHGTTWHKGPGPTYYHRIVVLDAATFSVIKYTHPFRLESADVPVEFALGITIDDYDRLSVAYSVFDGTSVVRRIPLWKVETLMVRQV